MAEYGPFVAIAFQTFLYLLGGYIIVVRSDAKQEMNAVAMHEDLREMKDELRKLADVVIVQAVQTEQIMNLTRQLTMLQQNYEDLRRGSGWVTKRTSLEGEYSGP